MVQTAVRTPAQIAYSPEDYASTFLKIRNKQRKLIPFQWNHVQRKLHGNRTRRDLILKSRQLGVTTYVQAELFRRVVTSSRGALTLSHDSDATAKLRLMADTFYDNLPTIEYNGSVYQKPARHYANATLTTYPEFGSVAAIATAGNLKAGRGDSYTDIHGSEVAFWTDAEAILAGAMQGGDPDIILESTPNGASGYFYNLCMEALAGRGVWRLHFFPWWADPTYRVPLQEGETLDYTNEERQLAEKHNLTPGQIAWRRNKKSELKALFIQEYPEDPVTCFLTSGNGYFTDILSAATWTAPAGATYQPGHVYTAGLDFGQSNDFTYMPVFDRTENVQVDYLYLNKTSWKEQRRRIKNMYNKWHITGFLGEANSIGSVNIEALQDDFIEIESFDTTNESKNRVMGEYYDALENGLRLLDWDVQKAEHYNFVATQLPSGVWRLAARKINESTEGHDDTVIGDALAIAARTQRLRARSFK